MRTRRRLLIALLTAGSLGLAAVPADAQQPIRLRAATFVPALGQQPSIPPGLSIAGYAQGVRGYYLVQFAGPVTGAARALVEARGAELLEYVPEFAFKVRMTPAQAAVVGSLQGVAWVGLFHPAFKLSPDLERDGPRLYKLRVEAGADVGLARADIAQTGAQIVSASGSVVVIAADSAQLDAVAHVLDVAWVENFRFHEKHNEYGAGVIMGSAMANNAGYDGAGQTVAVADTGLGGGTAGDGHRDLPGNRISAIHNWTAANNSCYNVTPNGAQDEDSGHGTHVALSVLGAGDPTTGAGKGTAPAASLVFQAVEEYADMKGLCALVYPDGYYLIGIPSDLRTLYQQAYNSGARVHSNSWGSDALGDYTIDSANTDDFQWDNPLMTITFSAGNSGTDANANGVIDNDSIGSPATAKNVITVGASENDRQGDNPCDTNLNYVTPDNPASTTCADQLGENLIRVYGDAWPSDFPADPIASDPAAGDAEQMAAFSSRGPTDDGRIKPDVVAPGTHVLSGYSDLHQRFYDPTNDVNLLNRFQHDGWVYPMNEFYKYFGGTSMSNPLTAGAAAVVRQFYAMEGHEATAALVKATLINSAVDMLDENNDGVDDNAFPIPNSHEGWGRVDVDNATDGSHDYVDNTAGLGTGGSATYNFNVAAGAPFKATLVWTDYPSTESATKNLVNDLDLTVTAPGGATYRGNVFGGGWSQTNGSADRTNNVENVYVQSAATGTWSVAVSGFNVPNGPQPFALVVDFAAGDSTNTPPTADDDAYQTAEDTPLVEAAPGVLDGDGDMDADGDTLTAVKVSDPSHGSLTLNADGGFTYTPNANFNGSDSFTYRASDGSALSNLATVTITVNPVNDPPVAVDDSYSTTKDTQLDVVAPGVLGNDTDVDGNSLTAVLATGVSNGSLTLNPDGSFSYTPNAGFSGTDSFTYRAHDGSADSNAATVTITVQAANTNTMHVADLDGNGTKQGSSRWKATVTITVHDAGGTVVANATVTGAWSNGATGTAQCTTGSNGQCSVSKARLSNTTPSVTFTVTNVTHATLSYDSDANRDPDGDSDGTAIVVTKP